MVRPRRSRCRSGVGTERLSHGMRLTWGHPGRRRRARAVEDSVWRRDMIYPYGFGRNSSAPRGSPRPRARAGVHLRRARGVERRDGRCARRGARRRGNAGAQGRLLAVGPQDGTAPSLMGRSTARSASPTPTRDQPLEVRRWRRDLRAARRSPERGCCDHALRSLIASAGRDPGAFEFTSETWEGSFTRTAQAWPVVDGNASTRHGRWRSPTPGSSAHPAPSPTRGPRRVPGRQRAGGFERLSDPRFGAQMTTMPIAPRAASDTATEWVPPTEPPATPRRARRSRGR